MKKEMIFLVFVVFLAGVVSADVYVGTTEGHISNTENEIVSGAFVRATSDQCVVQCSQETASDSGGYYVVANLNLPKRETVTVYAEKMTSLGLEFGTNTGTANDFQAAEVDVTICLPPPAPSLVDELNTHDTSVTLDWTSYADKKSYNVYDEFKIDSRDIVEDRGYGNKHEDVDGLSYAVHTWQVRTCNQFCCSEWQFDSFRVGNSAPSASELVIQEDTTPREVTLDWVSGVDSDGDETYDEYCYGIIDEEILCGVAEAPEIETAFGCNYYLWKVRTCETYTEHLCSEFSESGFIACGLSCPDCSSGEGDRRKVVEDISTLFVSSSGDILPNEDLGLDISFFSSVGEENLLFEIDSSEFQFENFILEGLDKGKRVVFGLIGKPYSIVEPGLYNLRLDAMSGGKVIYSEPFAVEIKEPPLLIVDIFRSVRASESRWWIVLIVVFVVGALAFLVLRMIKKGKLKFLSGNWLNGK